MKVPSVGNAHPWNLWGCRQGGRKDLYRGIFTPSIIHVSSWTLDDRSWDVEVCVFAQEELRSQSHKRPQNPLRERWPEASVVWWHLFSLLELAVGRMASGATGKTSQVSDHRSWFGEKFTLSLLVSLCREAVSDSWCGAYDFGSYVGKTSLFWICLCEESAGSRVLE